MTFPANPDDNFMVMAAFRYCLGRQTYAPGLCVEWLKRHWNHIEPSTRDIIEKELKVEYLSQVYGINNKFDIEMWHSFRLWALAQRHTGAM